MANRQQAMLKHHAMVSVWDGSQRRNGRAGVSVDIVEVDAGALKLVDEPVR